MFIDCFRTLRNRLLIALCYGWAGLTSLPTSADEITTTSEGGKRLHSGTVKFENDEWVILENDVGAWERLPKQDVMERVEKEAPPFVPAAEFAYRLLNLKEDDPLVRMRVTPECIAVLILEAPLTKQQEGRVDAVLSKMVKSYTQVAKAVEVFAKKQKLPQKKPQYPAVLRLIESQAVSDAAYGVDAELDNNLPVVSSDGWYEPISNVASFSMSAILAVDGTVTEVLVWQQLFHTGVLTRQAPIPWWWLLGVSAGFETAGTRVEGNHLKLNATTFPGLQEPEALDWDQLVSNHEYVTDYYSLRDQSWGLHWYLNNKNKTAVGRYWKRMADLTPLDKREVTAALADFKAAFGKPPSALKPLFEKAFTAASRTPPPGLPPEDVFWYAKEAFGQAKMNWVAEAVETGDVRMEGTLTNVSPLRARSYCVGFITNRGKSAVWFVDQLEPLKSVELRIQRAGDPQGANKSDKATKPAKSEGEHEVEEVWLISALPDSPEAAKWRQGELPTRRPVSE